MKRRITKYYNSNTKEKYFRPKNLILKKVDVTARQNILGMGPMTQGATHRSKKVLLLKKAYLKLHKKKFASKCA